MKDQRTFLYLLLIVLSIIRIYFYNYSDYNKFKYEFIKYLKTFEIPNITEYGKNILYFLLILLILFICFNYSNKLNYIISFFLIIFGLIQILNCFYTSEFGKSSFVQILGIFLTSFYFFKMKIDSKIGKIDEKKKMPNESKLNYNEKNEYNKKNEFEDKMILVENEKFENERKQFENEFEKKKLIKK